MSPDDEREAFWKAIHTVDDRVTELKAVVDTRNETMREAIKDAVREAMPRALLSDDQHAFVVMAMKREEQRAQYRQKVIDSATLWAIPTALGLIGFALWTLLKEYLVAHGLWR